MSNKKKLKINKITIVGYILLELVENGKVLKSDILSKGIAKQTMYNYISSIKCILVDIGRYDVEILSKDDVYMLVENS